MKFMSAYVKVTLGFEHRLESFFARLGTICARHPWRVLLCCTLFTFASLAGVLRFRFEDRPTHLWAIDGSKAAENQVFFDKFYPRVFRSESLIAVSKSTPKRILNRAALLALLEFITQIQTITMEQNTYRSYCIQNNAGNCIIRSILELWQYNATLIEQTSDIPQYINDRYEAYYQTPDFSVILGNAQTTMVNGTITLLTAEAISVTMVMKQEDELRDFDKKFITMARAYRNDVINVVFFASYSIILEFARSTLKTMPMFAASFGLLLLYVSAQLVRFHKPKDGTKKKCCPIFAPNSKIIIGLCGVFSVLISTIIAFCLSLLVGVFLSPISQVVAFLLVGIGVDDLFILVKSFERTQPDWSTEKRLKVAMRTSATTITVTSITDFAAFLVGATIRLPGLVFCFSRESSQLLCYDIVQVYCCIFFIVDFSSLTFAL